MDDKRLPPPQAPKPSLPPPRRPRTNPWTVFLLLVLGFIIAMWLITRGDKPSEIDYSFFRKQLRKVDQVEAEGQTFKSVREIRAARAQGKITEAQEEKLTFALTNIKSVVIDGQEVTGKFHDAPEKPNFTEAEKEDNDGKPPKLNEKFVVNLTEAGVRSEVLDEELINQGVEVQPKPPSDATGWLILAYIGIPLLFLLGLIWFFRRAQSQMMGGGFLGAFSKSGAKRYESGKTKVTFADVAGLANVKNDLQEVVEFLKSPEKFRKLGGRIPKGTLLVGPPGTGKTLIARAVAGEAGVPFFSINGSEFIQMFVGVGASRVRDLFQTARESSPCILFIDEIDAVGRIRGAGLGGGHDEREQTLNQILSEMDGFTPDEAVIVVAATNRPDVLDPALLRPGRFDRHVIVDRPNLKARVELFKVHTRDVPLSGDVDMQRLARGTAGLTGADIRNIVNEASLWATRQGHDKVAMDDFDHARDKVLMGPKREEVLNERERKITAYHEAGHALLAWIVPGADPVHKVTIIPRGRALGVTQLLPEEDRMNIGESSLRAMLVFILGGRAAEKLVFNEYSAGAEDDLKKATGLARRMVTAWGMSERLGPINLQTTEEHPFLGKEIHEHREFSEHTAQVIDEEIAVILHGAADQAKELLTKNRERLDNLTSALQEKEELEQEEIEAILGPSVNYKPSRNGQELHLDDGKVQTAPVGPASGRNGDS